MDKINSALTTKLKLLLLSNNNIVMDIISNKLPIELCHNITLFLIEPKTKLIWCHVCGESVNGLCPGLRCKDCCDHHCINRGDFYRNVYKSPPLTEQELQLALLHQPAHRD
jgi:hypothetical protein